MSNKGISNEAGENGHRQQDDDQPMEVIGDETSMYAMAFLALLAWLSQYLSRQNCTC